MTWVPARDGDTPGELVPGEDDVTEEPQAHEAKVPVDTFQKNLDLGDTPTSGVRRVQTF